MESSSIREAASLPRADGFRRGFVAASATTDPADEEAPGQTEIWLHGQITCAACGFRMGVSVPEGEVGHGFCPRCGAEHQAVGVNPAAVPERVAS